MGKPSVRCEGEECSIHVEVWERDPLHPLVVLSFIALFLMCLLAAPEATAIVCLACRVCKDDEEHFKGC